MFKGMQLQLGYFFFFLFFNYLHLRLYCRCRLQSIHLPARNIVEGTVLYVCIDSARQVIMRGVFLICGLLNALGTGSIVEAQN